MLSSKAIEARASDFDDRFDDRFDDDGDDDDVDDDDGDQCDDDYSGLAVAKVD